MRLLKAALLASCLAIAAAPPVAAQEVVTIAGVQATRIVIAPPQTALERTIKQALSEAYSSATRGTRAYDQAQKLYFFYGARHFQPLWLSTAPDGSVSFSDKAESIVAVFRKAALEGFNPSDYLTPGLDVAAAGSDPQKLAALETAFSAAVIRYAQDAYGGRVNPLDVNDQWTIAPKRLNAAEVLIKLAESDDPAAILEDLSPHSREFVALKAALARFYDSDEIVDSAVAIPDGPMLRPGMQDDRVTLLRQRLDVPEPEIPESASSDAQATVDINYDAPLVAAVKAFQEGLGLTADGIVGPATVAALNGGAATTKEDIIANMERWRWEPDDMGDFQVLVNIPEFRLGIYDHGHLAYATRVVVGRPQNQTPVFNNSIKHIVVNPYWNVPPSIAVNEIKPHLLSNPGYLDSQNMEMLSGGKVINASAIDWTTTNINNFHVRQKPGGGNALGQIKFLFPNEHDVYLHDTPSKSLFARSYRAYSHGCVRVQNPMDFADALLRTSNPQITEASLESMFGPSEKWVNLTNFVPVHIAYFTLRVDEDGTIRSYGDVYGMNKRLIELLGLSPTPAVAG
jgi:murein L,D-transpeptidase YcbB/YkuD